MARRRRGSHGEAYFHVINRSVRKAPLFRRPNDYRAFLEVLRQGLERHPARLISYCVMANHWHLVMGPVDPSRVSKLMHWVTVTHAVRWHHHRNTVGQGPVYQSRFKSFHIEAAAQLMRACRYVERNALRAGLVKRAQDWPWCSLAARLLPQATLPLVSTPFLESDAWIQYVNAPQQAEELGRPVPKHAKSVENRSDPLYDGAEAPGQFTNGAERGKNGVGVGGRGDHHQAHAHVERAEHLRVVDLPRALQPAKQRRHRPALAVK